MSNAQSPASEADVALLRETAAAAQAGDFPRAAGLAERALADGLQHPLFYRLRGMRAEQAGRVEDAVADYRAALADAPDDPLVLTRLGACLAAQGRSAEAMQALEAALARRPNFAPALADRGWLLETLGDLAGARAAYRQALAADPTHARAQAALALLAARAGQWADAREAAAKAQAITPDSTGARLALAMAALGEGDAAAAVREARILLDGPPPPSHERAVVLTVMGDALDRMGRTAEAFGSWLSANEALRNLYAPQFGAGGTETGHALAERLRKGFEAVDPTLWRREHAPAAPERGAGHVFVVGFPRSGTTLLGQVLAAHPDVTTLDELETLAAAGRAYLADPGGLQRLAAAGEAELDGFREAYWRTVRAQGVAPEDGTFVDKLPMNTLGLPLIARLFPEAKVIFVRRDPRDVLLSCFRRQFVINGTNWEFLSLAGAARFYDAVMGLAERYMAALPLDVAVLRYEDLVADLAGETEKLRAFLGLAEDPAMAAFAGSERAADIATPSAAQVAGGVFEGAGQWKRYASQLAPVTPVLRPWIEAFGY
jgi:tetratricopeptide (TPR) repeat protein